MAGCSGADDRFVGMRSLRIEDVAKWLGLAVRNGAAGPCPCCNRQRRGHDDRRLPIRLRGGWWCTRCHEKGDCIALACWGIFGTRLTAGDPRWRDLFAWFDERGHGGSAFSAPRPAAEATRSHGRPPPPIAEVEHLWGSAADVAADPACSAWLTSRMIEVSAVARYDLARALPASLLPRWAGTRFGSWWESDHRLIVPAFTPGGRMASFQARLVVPSRQHGTRKVMFPSGFTSSGLVMANATARGMLGQPPVSGTADPRLVLIVEGLPDFLTWSTRLGSDGETPWAVFGIWSGGWNNMFSEAIADGSSIVLRLHDDDSGHRYADEIAATFAGRDVALTQTYAGKVTQ